MTQIPIQTPPMDGYPLELFLNRDHALQYQCAICNKVCRDPVQLNCNEGHAFCNQCISSEPHTVVTTEPIYYDPNNKSNELAVNEDYAAQTQIQVSTTNTMCPICKVRRCSKLPCPLIAENISLLSIRCTNAPYGCQWQGTLSQLVPHCQSSCINSVNCSCPFHVFGCSVANISRTDLVSHFQVAQMEHLQLQINAIRALQLGFTHMSAQLQTVNAQQVQLTTLITAYEHKLNEIQTEQRQAPPKESKSKPQQNLQFNINMNHNKKEEEDDYHRWKHNPILNMMSSMQKQIISHHAITTQNKIEQIANKYNLAELSELFVHKINKKTDYIPTFHKKLLVIRGSNTKDSKHHGVLAVDLHNKRKYPLHYDDPITKYMTWDIEFAGLTVIHNVESSMFRKSIEHPKEGMLFAVKHGLDHEGNMQENEHRKDHRDDYLESKYNEHKANKESHGQAEMDGLVDMTTQTRHCSVLLRCGGSRVATTETTDAVNGLVLNTGDWISSLPRLKTARYGATAVYSQSHGVLVVGGKDDYQQLDSVEAWNVGNGEREWKYLASMGAQRYSACCTCYASKTNDDECLFVGGGWNAKGWLKTCEMYSFAGGYWKEIAPMNVKRYGGGCCVWNKASGNSSIVVGGGANANASKSVELYDLYKNKWYTLPDTHAKHRNGPSVWVCKEYGKLLSPFNGMLMIAGDTWTKGDQQQTYGAINGMIEMYDPREWRQTWFIVEDLRNILSDRKDAIVRGMIPFS